MGSTSFWPTNNIDRSSHKPEDPMVYSIWNMVYDIEKIVYRIDNHPYGVWIMVI